MVQLLHGFRPRLLLRFPCQPRGLTRPHGLMPLPQVLEPYSGELLWRGLARPLRLRRGCRQSSLLSLLAPRFGKLRAYCESILGRDLLPCRLRPHALPREIFGRSLRRMALGLSFRIREVRALLRSRFARTRLPKRRKLLTRLLRLSLASFLVSKWLRHASNYYIICPKRLGRSAPEQTIARTLLRHTPILTAADRFASRRDRPNDLLLKLVILGIGKAIKHIVMARCAGHSHD